MSPSCCALSKAFEISKNTFLTSRGGLQSMMHIFGKLWRDAFIHKNQIVKNQTDFHKASYFLVDIQILN